MVIQGLSCAIGIFLQPLDNNFIISWFVAAFVLVSQIFTHMVMMWESLTKQQQHNAFLRHLNDIEVAFKLRLRMDIGKVKIMKKLTKALIILSIISVGGLIIFGVGVIISNDPGYFWWAIFAILAMRLRLLQGQFYVELLAHYVMSLNQKLNQVVRLKTKGDQPFLDTDNRNLRTLEYLNHIKELYSNIYEAFYCFNEIAQTSLFASTVSYFLDCTCHIYWSLLVMDKLLPTTSILFALATIIPLCTNLYKFCYVCQQVKEESRRTSVLVSRLAVADSPYTGLDLQQNYKALVYDFSLQLIHQHFVVTGKRFFNFDLQCIFGICVLILTHLIILIQFSKNYDISNTKNQSQTVN
uniref:Gustatory receptor n=1 Tax=Stomoxys calcitrans TaxID=35570 RepID=A0A1I8Q4A3_STOCA